jgi:hypothetical protein
MASVRGVLNIQSLIELSSLVREFILYVDVHRTGLHPRAYLRHASFVIRGYIISRMGFCRAIAMIAKLYERNTFVVSNRGAERFADRAARRGHYVSIRS